MKKFIFLIFMIFNFTVFAYDPAVDEAETLYKEAKKLTVEYIASCRTLKTISAKEITPEQKTALDEIIRHQEMTINVYDKSLATINKLKQDYDYLEIGEKEAALKAVTDKNETLKKVIDSLKTAIQINREAINSY